MCLGVCFVLSPTGYGAPSRRWRENRGKRFEFAIDGSEDEDEDEDEYGFTDEDGEDFEINAYKDVDEFSWGTVFYIAISQTPQMNKV